MTTKHSVYASDAPVFADETVSAQPQRDVIYNNERSQTPPEAFARSPSPTIPKEEICVEAPLLQAEQRYTFDGLREGTGTVPGYKSCLREPLLNRNPAPQQPQVDPSRHPGGPVILDILSSNGRAIEANTSPSYLQQDALDAVQIMHRGVYLTSYEKDGPKERWFKIASYPNHNGAMGAFGREHCLVKMASPDAEEVKERFPLTALLGVQRGAGNPTFRPYFKSHGFVNGVSMNTSHAVHPTSLCFTLWFSLGGSFRSLDLVAVNETIYGNCIRAFDAIRSANSTTNHTFGKEPSSDSVPKAPRPEFQPQNTRSRWVKKTGSFCSIL